jgi:DNA-binding GntR family transcriptional regulator
VKLSQLAYVRFKESLFDRRIRPGAVLSQGELGDILGVPIGPLREAVQVLEAEGLLTVMPRSGIRIFKPDMKRFRDVFQLRRMIEVEAVMRFVERPNEAVLDRLEREHVDHLARVEATPDALGLVDATTAIDRDLHRMLVNAMDNPIVSGVYERAVWQIQLVRMDSDYALSVALIRRTMQEHLRIIAALRSHDAEAARVAMEDHLLQAIRRAIDF